MARLSAVMADYFIPRLTGLIGLLGITIGATKSPELTTTTPRLTRRLPVKVPLGVLAASVHCLLVPALVTFPVSAGSDESLCQFSGLLRGLWVMFFNPHPQFRAQYAEKLLQNDYISDLLFSLLRGANPLLVEVGES